MNDTGLPRIVIVCGPTGVGKTSFAVALARRFGGQIVSADSMQLYRHMDIGTAKPGADEKRAVPHHMIDIIEPDRPFDAAAYSRQADRVVQSLLERSIRPFVVGGTGLYIKALLYGLFQTPAADAGVRRKLKAQLAAEGSGALHARLASLDPDAAARIHPHDPFRIVRALEVIEMTGRTISAHHQAHAFRNSRYKAFSLGLTLPRDQLYARIDRRVEAMVAAGLLDETRRLLSAGYDPSLKAMQALGYRHMVDFIFGRLGWQETIESLKRDHRRYAKRQMTWFRADPGIQWLMPQEEDKAAQMIRSFFSIL